MTSWNFANFLVIFVDFLTFFYEYFKDFIRDNLNIQMK